MSGGVGDVSNLHAECMLSRVLLCNTSESWCWLKCWHEANEVRAFHPPELEFSSCGSVDVVNLQLSVNQLYEYFLHGSMFTGEQSPWRRHLVFLWLKACSAFAFLQASAHA